MSLSFASVSRPVARPSLLAFLVPSLLRSIPTALAPPPAPTATGESVSIWQSLQDLLPSIVLAVPKKQTSKRAKRMRSLNKHLRPKLNINHCPACGLPKLHAHICNECLSSIQRDLKNEARIKELIAKDFAKKNGLEEPEFKRTPNYLETGNPGPSRTAVAEVAKTEVEGKEERP